MKYYFRHVFLIIMATLLILVAGSRAEVQAQAPTPDETGAIVFITAPANGETVSGIITIKGAADFPDFFKYEVFLQSGKSLIWVATVYAPVINGTLAHLDTKTIGDGAYQMVIRQVRADSNYTDFMGPTITIANGLGAPVHFPEVQSSPLYPPLRGALLRVANCSGFNAEFDYVSPQGFCSHGNLWIMGKMQEQPLCTTVDVFLIPDCEYRGTAMSEDGKGEAVTYQFVAEQGKIYEFNYPGGRRFFLGEIKGDARDPSDTGGLDRDDPARLQIPSAAMEGSAGSSSAPVSAPAAGQAAPASTPAPAATQAPATASDSSTGANQSELLLPVSGQASESNMPFTLVAAALILFMVVGGVVALQRGRQQNS